MRAVTAGEARAAAADWVRRHAAPDRGFVGAYISGSTVALADDEKVPTGSDLDIMVVTEETAPGRGPSGRGKFRHRGALLEATYLPWSLLAAPERVLASYHLAGAFRTDTVIADPSGRLGALRQAVARGFAEPRWVRLRRAEALNRVTEGLRGLDVTRPWPQAVTAWLFPTGVTTHVLLVSGLRNPTVRLRYLAVRELLAERGRADYYEELLELLGCASLTASRAGRHLDALADTFDAAAEVARTPFPFSSDISPVARPIAIDASRELIAAGRHREVAFWLAATFARCHTILDADAPEPLRRALAPAFGELLADLGLTSPADLRERAGTVLAGLPRLETIAEEILGATPAEARR